MALMNLWNLNDVDFFMERVIANVIFIMQVKCHSLSLLSMFLYGLCKNVLVTCVLRICYISTFVYVPFGHCSETDWTVEEVSGVTVEESFQDLPNELGRLHFSFIFVMSLSVS